jgi:hypothetical protein
MQAHVLAQLGEHDAACAAAGDAFDTFVEMGEARGLGALQRGCKERGLTLPGDRTF